MPAEFDPYSTPPPPRLRRFLRCATCGRLVACTPDEVSGYVASGWPNCCGDTMAYLTWSVPPGPDDTPLELPALPPPG